MTEQRPTSSRDWSPEARQEFYRRRRGRNWALLAALIALCGLLYAVSVVKLYHAGQMW
ncbi:MAG TPA: hypothetical protein PLV07_04805 [Acidiphilium sp.]|jgi:hypothetical protein|uniref:hypothetical protein n=1 Tax=unclassified Acidiphilium TaxID=2617493 RepID=UPI00157AA895|nr:MULTISPECIES: hypothetical protein [unclassified Acidiphilium]HQT60684.1 hypothetical protein [Acidiphilium sp.]HQU10881.1 hypothetical protein [Acidiphilium sp.]